MAARIRCARSRTTRQVPATPGPAVPGGPSIAPTGFPFGGNALLFNNMELRFPLIGDNIGGVLFHDMGNVYSSLGDMSFRFHQTTCRTSITCVHAVGFGIRYRTPIGPIRVDLAYSINPPSYNGFGGTPDQLLQCNPNLEPGYRADLHAVADRTSATFSSSFP